jgi:putative effector of murein hydrolase
MNELLNTPLFGLVLTISTGALFWRLKSIKALFWLNPLLISVLFIIAFLQLLRIPYEVYQTGGEYIHFFLGPITVMLALPLYENAHVLKRHKQAILLSVSLGSLSALVTVFFLGHLLGLEKVFIHSLMPKSMTTPLGISASHMLDALVGLSVLSIVITGIFGSLISLLLFKVLNIRSNIAKGLALGTCSHAIGTAKAYEISSLSGAISALSIGLSGVISIGWISLYLFVVTG